MKYKYKSALLFFTIITLFLTAFISAFGQSRTNQLYRPCPGTVQRAVVEIRANGDVNIVPCPTGKFLVNGVETSVTGLANLNGLIGGTQTFEIGGNDTAGWDSSSTTHTLNLPINGLIADREDNIGGTFPIIPYNDQRKLNWDSPLAYNSNTDAISFGYDFWPTPAYFAHHDGYTFFAIGGGSPQLDAGDEGFFYQNDNSNENSMFRVNANYFYFSGSGNGLELRSNGESRLDGSLVRLGNGEYNAILSTDSGFTVNSDGETVFDVSFTNSAISFGRDYHMASPISVNFQNISKFGIQGEYKTTPGNATLNMPVGAITFTTGSNRVIVSNTNVKASDLILITPQNTDSTCKTFWVDQVEDGSFSIWANANCTGEARVAFFHISLIDNSMMD